MLNGELLIFALVGFFFLLGNHVLSCQEQMNNITLCFRIETFLSIVVQILARI